MALLGRSNNEFHVRGRTLPIPGKMISVALLCLH